MAPLHPAPIKVLLPDTNSPPADHGQDDTQIYKFWKVEDFFNGIDKRSQQPTLLDDGMMSAFSPVDGPIKGCIVAPNDALTLEVTLSDTSLLLIELLRFDTFRIRWGPGKHSPSEYSQQLSRCIVMNTLNELRYELASEEKYQLTAVFEDLHSITDSLGPRAEWSICKSGIEWMKILIFMQDFSIQAWRNVNLNKAPGGVKIDATPQWSCVWSTTSASDKANPPLLCRKDVEGNYATCLSTVKRGKMMGFGEQGGLNLLKDKQQLNLFNYDNLAYSSVYGEQALNPSEPLYHSDPFGVELNGVAGHASCIGTFVDDVSQLFFNLGSKSDGVMQIGSRFADLEVHITCATDLEHACLSHSSCVGRGKLFPRFMLGYQQGCYGYDTKDKVMACAENHRKYGIHIDGIHIDVDLQARYRTFTMDDGPNGKFPDPKGMFTWLKELGIKCSTNITPVISSEDDSGKDYWNPGSSARQVYNTLDEGLSKGCFIKDQRWNNTANPPTYSYWEGGQLRQGASAHIDNMNNAATEYRGGVSYGADMGTSGVYPDLGRPEVRDWWGQQYADLFDAGLSMVWQDMTTPCIKIGVGDMKSFPFRLLLSDDSITGRDGQGILTPALKVNNLYSYNLHKATYKGLQRLSSRKGLRNFIIGRGSFTGQHRYSGTWTGDNVSSWQFLRINIQQVISMGIGGTIITGADVGGFESSPWDSQWCDPCLLIRWTLANTLLPWMRNHYIGKPGKKLFQEPYAYYENAWREPAQRKLYESVLPICRYYITLRYTLMQLLYDTYFDSLFTGSSIARSLLHTDPWDTSLLDVNSQYLAQEYVAGKDLIVAPIVYSEQELDLLSNDSWKVYLPSGSSFYDFNLHLQASSSDIVNPKLKPSWVYLTAPIKGGTTFDYSSSIDRYVEGDGKHLPYLLPIFVREGAVFPTIVSEDYTGQLKPNPVTIHCYPIINTEVQSHEYNLYLDDGISSASAPSQLPQFRLDKLSDAQSDYRQIHFTHSCSSQKGEKIRTLEVKLVHGKYDIDRVKADLGPVLTIQVWHDYSDAAAASKGELIGTKENGKSESLQSHYDSSLNATMIEVPVDDIELRKLTFTYVL